MVAFSKPVPEQFETDEYEVLEVALQDLKTSRQKPLAEFQKDAEEAYSRVRGQLDRTLAICTDTYDRDYKYIDRKKPWWLNDVNKREAIAHTAMIRQAATIYLKGYPDARIERIAALNGLAHILLEASIVLASTTDASERYHRLMKQAADRIKAAEPSAEWKGISLEELPQNVLSAQEVQDIANAANVECELWIDAFLPAIKRQINFFIDRTARNYAGRAKLAEKLRMLCDKVEKTFPRDRGAMSGRLVDDLLSFQDNVAFGNRVLRFAQHKFLSEE